MRHIYNCEQTSLPRAISSYDMNDSSSRYMPPISDTQHSSFDDSIPTPTVKGQFDFTSTARYGCLNNDWVLIIYLFVNRQRLELMREMYTNAADSSPTSPDQNVDSALMSDTSSSSIPTDPFYDRFPWFRPIGR